MITLIRASGANPDFQELVKLLDAYLNESYGVLQKSYDAYNDINLIIHSIVLYDDAIPIGCGAMKPFDSTSIEIKRMFVKPESRGIGLASRILCELEDWARELGFSRAILETGIKQKEAIRLYTKNNYRQIENFGQYKGNNNSLCFRKELI